VLGQLEACGLTRVWVLGPAHHVARLLPRHQVVPVPQPPGAGFFANLAAGAAAVDSRAGEAVLVLFGDHPLGTASALRAFLAGCAPHLEQADFFHALALQAAYREYGAWFHRTSAHARDMSGRASGFSLAIPSRLRRLAALGPLYDVRKLERVRSVLGLLLRVPRWLGPDLPAGVLDTLVLYLAKEMEKRARGGGRAARLAAAFEGWLAARVPIARLERYAARVLDAERGVRIVPVAHGGIAIDVDFAEELEALELHWDALAAIAARQDAALSRACGCRPAAPP
jgi:hypothetical protein